MKWRVRPDDHRAVADRMPTLAERASLPQTHTLEDRPLFLGEHQHSLDVKGRVILPARFRERLANGLVFAPSQDRCIDVYPLTAFEKRVEELRAVPREDQRARAYLRVFLAGAQEERPDAQGRVTVPPRLRTYAGLDKDLTINGADEKVEIWDRATWEAYRDQAEDAFANLDGSFTP